MSKGIRVVFRLGATLPIAIGALLCNASALAQEEVAIFEEIVVTVQRREQSILDVPVAVSAISGAEIQAAGIKDMFDLQQNVVGLIVGQSQTSTSTNFSIRGVGSTSNNFGVESSVGLYVDGVYRSRQSSLINDLADIETVEVARGPQGTLFGKNTASGAIIVRTARPTSERNAYFDVTAGDYGLVRLSAASNFSFTDNVAMRGTIFASQRDGYVDDLYLGDNIYNDRDRWGARLQLGVNEPGDDFNMRVIADYAEIDEACCVAVTRIDGLVSHGNLTDPGSDGAMMLLGGTLFTDFPYPPGIFPPNVQTGVGFEDYVVAYNRPPRSTNEDFGLSVEFNKDLGDTATLTSITAWRNFNTFDDIDADFTDLEIISRTNDAEVESLSQEFRISGEFGEGSNYVVGAYYFGQTIDSETFTGDASGPDGVLGAYLGLANQELLNSATTFINSVNQLAGPPYPTAGVPFTPGVYANDIVNQDHSGWAVFGQVDWALGENFVLTLGARYTDETKKIKSSLEQTAQGPFADVDALLLTACRLDQPAGCFATLPEEIQNMGPPDFMDPATAAIFIPFGFDDWGSYLFAPLAPQEPYDDKISDDQVTGTVKLSWFPGVSSLVYLSYTTGFKSGGTNVDRLPPGFPNLFDAETSESIELGFKGEWGPVQFKTALYQTEFDDFQANTFTGTGFNLQNAGQLTINGIEVEMVWRPTDSTEIQANFSHNEGEYDKFIFGTCWDTYPFHTGIPDPGEGSGASDEQCDRTGDTLPYNPEDRAFIALTQDIELNDNLLLFLRGEYTYASDQFTDGDVDPFTRQDSLELINVRLGLDFARLNSTLTLWGRNITDERWYAGSFDQPIGLGRMNSYPAEPATYGLTYTMHFD